jgi:YD repeat-containing protein
VGTGYELSTYNGFNQLIETVKDGVATHYAYKPDGLRLSKKTGGMTTTHIWDGSYIVLDIAGAEAVKYVRGIGLIKRDAGYYLYNAHGDVVQITDALGSVVQTYDYDAFGNERAPSRIDTNPFRYCGEYLDLETGRYTCGRGIMIRSGTIC